MLNNKALEKLIMFDPRNKNQQRKLLEQIGSKVYDESVKTMQFNPSEYTNSSANM
jgi:hypothetical protein